jgi:hypothetical protein
MNTDKFKTAQMKWNENNNEKLLQASKKFYENNREKKCRQMTELRLRKGFSVKQVTLDKYNLKKEDYLKI